MAAESYPDDLRYHREHDWARIDGDEATFGITWFAQDALGELVHFEAPEDGATVNKDQGYAEASRARAVPTVMPRFSARTSKANRPFPADPEQATADRSAGGCPCRGR